MKELKHMEELLDKYYQGKTSISEEKILRDFFEGDDVPDHFRAEAEIFGFFNREKEATLSGEMEANFDRIISGAKSRNLNLGRGLKYYWLSGAAAVILILIGIFVDLKLRENNAYRAGQDTFEDPYLAYNEARKVLYLVSEKMNTGREPLKNLEKLDSGVDYMHPVFSFGAGIQHLEHLSTLEKTKKLISK